MTDQSVKNFGKRKPTQPVYEEPTSRKRSSQVALLLMGTMAVGGGAYALMPGERCDPNRPTIEQQGCWQSSSSSSSGWHYSGNSGSSWGNSGSTSSSGRSNFASSSSSSSSGLSTASSTSNHVARSGFGSFGSHFSGGG